MVYSAILCKNTGVGCRFLLQGIFPIQGLKQNLLHLPFISTKVESLGQNSLFCPQTTFLGACIVLLHCASFPGPKA